MQSLISVIVALVALIWFIPADPVDGKTHFTCRKSELTLKEERESNRSSRTNTAFDRSFVGPYTSADEPLLIEFRSLDKSGLRRTVEGRLKWLGLPSDLRFLNPSDC